MIRLSQEREPEIYATPRRFGTILENVHLDIDTRHLDLDDQRYTENTRAVYPVTHIPNAIYPGIGGHPTPTFSACFGASFMALHPAVYAKLLGEHIQHDHVHCWLINTGWTGGSYGTGERIHLPHTRAMLNAAMNGELDDVPLHTDPIFHLQVPESCPGIPTEMLQPANTWSDQQAYDVTARKLAAAFRENFEKFADMVSPEVRDSGPGID